MGRLRTNAGPGLLRSPEELRCEDEAACAGYGFHPGTDAFTSCPEQLAIPDLIGAKPGSISALGGRRSRWFRTRLSLVRLLRALTACLIPG